MPDSLEKPSLLDLAQTKAEEWRQKVEAEEEEVIYDSYQKASDDAEKEYSEMRRKASQFDEMKKTMEGSLYSLFIQHVQCKVDYIACLHNGFQNLKDIIDRMEAYEYAGAKIISQAMEEKAKDHQSQVLREKGQEGRA